MKKRSKRLHLTEEEKQLRKQKREIALRKKYFDLSRQLRIDGMTEYQYLRAFNPKKVKQLLKFEKEEAK